MMTCFDLMAFSISPSVAICQRNLRSTDRIQSSCPQRTLLAKAFFHSPHPSGCSHEDIIHFNAPIDNSPAFWCICWQLCEVNFFKDQIIIIIRHGDIGSIHSLSLFLFGFHGVGGSSLSLSQLEVPRSIGLTLSDEMFVYDHGELQLWQKNTDHSRNGWLFTKIIFIINIIVLGW